MLISESSNEFDNRWGCRPSSIKLGMLGVVVMAFGLNSRIGQMLDLHLQAKFLAALLHHLRQLQHIELLRELVEHPEFTALGRVQAGDLDAANRVANVEEAARLATFAVYRQRIAQALPAHRSGSARCRRPRRNRSG